MTRSLTLLFATFLALVSAASGGTEYYSGKEMNQTQAIRPPEWYHDNEWNISLWGAYAFTTENRQRLAKEQALGSVRVVDAPAFGYLEADHAWGGGLDLTYFFHRYFGVGVEGYLLDATRRTLDKEGFVRKTPSGPEPISFSNNTGPDSRTIGAALATFTLRYPFAGSRFAPFVWAGGGAIFNGGERDHVFSFVGSFNPQADVYQFFTTHSDSKTKPIGQFGGGVEMRLTPHIGWINDFSWNVVDGSNNNFGMGRTGVTFAF